MSPPDEHESFEESYWTSDSQYRKFEDYDAALRALCVWHAGFWRMTASDLPAPGRHVDAGCGHGAIVHDLLARGWDAQGFDISQWMIEQAREHSPALAERFAVGELRDVPFEGLFDLITCLEVLEHVPDPVRDLRALASRLRPGGRLIATTPNLRPLMPWGDAVASDPTHVNVHEPSWWRASAELAGLRARVRTFVSVPLLWRAHPAGSRWVPLGSRTGPGVLIVADR